MLGLAHRGFSLTDPKRHVIHTLHAIGYKSVLAGIQHVAAKPEQVGYTEIMRPASKKAADVATQAVAFLDSKPTGPFFLDAGFQETHREYDAPTAEDDARYIQPPAPMPDTPITRKDMAGFHASARKLDRAVGRILDALARNKMRVVPGLTSKAMSVASGYAPRAIVAPIVGSFYKKLGG